MDEHQSKAKQEHKDFLRDVANEVYGIVRKPANIARFRKQVKIFCEKNEAHKKEVEQLKKASEADSKLKAAIRKKERERWGKTIDEMTEDEISEILPPDDDMLKPPEGYEGYVCYDGRFIPQPKTISLFTYLTPPAHYYYFPDDYIGNWNVMEKLTDSEKLICWYALLTTIHDRKIFGRPIYNKEVYNGGWNLRDTWIQELFSRCEYFEHGTYDDNKDTRDWIERAFGDVKEDLRGKKPAETERNAITATLRKIWTWVKRIPRWIYVLVLFLAALLTCIYFLWWLWTTFWKK